MLEAQRRLGPEKVTLPELPGRVRFLSNFMLLQNCDPFGYEIEQLTDTSAAADWFPDPGARFHLIRTKVYGLEKFQNAPNFFEPPIAHLAFHLWDPLPYVYVLPRGSDGVVDFDSMGCASSDGDTPANVFTLPNVNAISHYRVAVSLRQVRMRSEGSTEPR